MSAELAHARAVDRLTRGGRRARHAARQVGRRRRGRPRHAGRLQHAARRAISTWSRRAKEYIAAGDIFQVVLSQRFEAPFTLPPFALYRALRRINPSPFLYYLDFGGFALVGSSPEILVRVRDGEVTIRPIAGTRPRGGTPEEDQALEAELLADPKERAEHLMLLDLGRNDVGRVAEIGTVKVTDQFFLEYYSHVMHIVSNVVGRLDRRHDTLDALAAGFPAGTVSGAPKVRAMQIIDELELEKRGIYAGCVGYFSADGDDGHLHRAAHLDRQGRQACTSRRAPASSPTRCPRASTQECVAKARALFRAAEEAVRFASGVGRGQWTASGQRAGRRSPILFSDDGGRRGCPIPAAYPFGPSNEA